MTPSDTNPKTCILGATGCIGFETTLHLLQAGSDVLAVVRSKSKLQQMLESRGMSDQDGLSILEMDLFAKNALADSTVQQQVTDCDYILNTASKPVSLAPWSNANREWRSVVSLLTKDIVGIAAKSDNAPHVIAFCGPEYFVGYDEKISRLQIILPKVLNSFVAAFRDNHEEAHFLLASAYEKWSVLRCGSIRPASGGLGNAGRIGMDLHKDRSDYRKGKGKSLIMEDLAAYLAEKIQSGGMSEFESQMPFLFNTEF